MAPEDRRSGAIAHDMPCSFCGCSNHGLDACTCGCDDHTLLGIDTALGG